MTTDEVFAVIRQQNEAIIALLARLVWTPEKLAAVVKSRKSDPEAYVRVYNAMDGEKTITELAEIARVKRPTMSAVLQLWRDEGIALTVGTDDQPRYKRLMRLPEKRNSRDAEPQAQESAVVEETQESNATNGQ
jgi:hypothetical protein